jgi:hypothetical protein
MANPTLETLRGTTLQTILNTGASLATATNALGSAITLTDLHYPLADILFNGTFASAPAASQLILCWFLREDGAGNYEDGAAGALVAGVPARNPDFAIPVEPVSTAQVIIIPDVPLPPGPFKLLLQNNAGQTLNSGYTVKLYASTFTYPNV